ncbi:unnamed protein product [Symbiodinium pilosum]|uniref:R3H domain-containing protein n=1 Tax=Symbiodinium pilosum TaxID=2952 RepID=A0A812K1L9_SYMPI|nr:unnamed protein product [Symbiodinium pilosum]
MTKVEMDFYFCQTSYPQERERFLEEVFERATVDVLDAFRAGESTSLNHLDYVEKLSSEEISKICKVRALWRLTKVFSEFWRGASMEEGLQTLLAGAPSSLHQRIHWFWSFCQDGTAGDTPPTEVYDQLGVPALSGEPSASRRARLRAQSAKERMNMQESLRAHLDAIRRLTQDEAFHGYITLPSNLSRNERAFLHRIADELGLNHESVGEGPQRALRIWRADSASG